MLLNFTQSLQSLSIIAFVVSLRTIFGRQTKTNVNGNNILPGWSEDNFIDCTFCLDYDNFRSLNIFGCRLKQMPSCIGNTCYMRQHKNQEYFLFTSGCLNLTRDRYQVLKYLTSKTASKREDSNATQLCEVSHINTCLCSNQARCNNVSVHFPFIEYVDPIFRNIDFDEISHFKYFLPNDPILENVTKQPIKDEYFFIKDVSTHTNSAGPDHFDKVTSPFLSSIAFTSFFSLFLKIFFI